MKSGTSSDEETSVLRLDVYKYHKSGKAIVYHLPRKGIGVIVLDLTPDLTEISKVRTVRSLQRGNLRTTEYQLEVELKLSKRPPNEYEINAKLLRVLTRGDTNIARWQKEPSLGRLPVSARSEATEEERAWAGERSGTIGQGFVVLIFAVASLAITVSLISGGNFVGLFVSVITGLMGLSALLMLLRFDWRLPKPADPEKMKELQRHKLQLRQNEEKAEQDTLTAFDMRLKDFAGWQSLSPQEFEYAVARALETSGFSSTKVTRSSKDGAVDIEATDEAGRTTIVQAKKYSQNVGVAVVRELVGVRSTRPDVERVIIFSLVGFTRGARELAAETGIELMDARSLTLRM